MFFFLCKGAKKIGFKYVTQATELLTHNVKIIKRTADKPLRLTLCIQKRNKFCELFLSWGNVILQFPHLENLSAKVGNPSPIFFQNIRKIQDIYENWVFGVRLIPNSSDHEPDEIDDRGFIQGTKKLHWGCKMKSHWYNLFCCRSFHYYFEKSLKGQFYQLCVFVKTSIPSIGPWWETTHIFFQWNQWK